MCVMYLLDWCPNGLAGAPKVALLQNREGVPQAIQWIQVAISPVPRELARGKTTDGPASVGIVRDLQAPKTRVYAVHLLVTDPF
jgi:hypothetical protein